MKYEQGETRYTVVVTFNGINHDISPQGEPLVYDAGFSMAEAVEVQAAVADEMRAARIGRSRDDLPGLLWGVDWHTHIVPESNKRMAVPERCAVRHGWERDIETLEEFKARPHKGVLFNGQPFTKRLTSEEYLREQGLRANADRFHTDTCTCIVCFGDKKPGLPAEQEEERMNARRRRQYNRRPAGK